MTGSGYYQSICALGALALLTMLGALLALDRTVGGGGLVPAAHRHLAKYSLRRISARASARAAHGLHLPTSTDHSGGPRGSTCTRPHAPPGMRRVLLVGDSTTRRASLYGMLRILQDCGMNVTEGPEDLKESGLIDTHGPSLKWYTDRGWHVSFLPCSRISGCMKCPNTQCDAPHLLKGGTVPAHVDFHAALFLDAKPTGHVIDFSWKPQFGKSDPGFLEGYCDKEYDAVLINKGLHDAVFADPGHLTFAASRKHLDQLQHSLARCWARPAHAQSAPAPRPAPTPCQVFIETQPAVRDGPLCAMCAPVNTLLDKTAVAIRVHPYWGARVIDARARSMILQQLPFDNYHYHRASGLHQFIWNSMHNFAGSQGAYGHEALKKAEDGETAKKRDKMGQVIKLKGKAQLEDLQNLHGLEGTQPFKPNAAEQTLLKATLQSFQYANQFSPNDAELAGLIRRVKRMLRLPAR